MANGQIGSLSNLSIFGVADQDPLGSDGTTPKTKPSANWFTRIGGITNVPEVPNTTSSVDVTSLDHDRITEIAGIVENSSWDISGYWLSDDKGQNILRNFADGNNTPLYFIIIPKGQNKAIQFRGISKGLSMAGMTSNSAQTFSGSISITSKPTILATGTGTTSLGENVIAPFGTTGGGTTSGKDAGVTS